MFDFTIEKDGTIWADIDTDKCLEKFKEAYGRFTVPGYEMYLLDKAPICVHVVIAPWFFEDLAIEEIKQYVNS